MKGKIGLLALILRCILQILIAFGFDQICKVVYWCFPLLVFRPYHPKYFTTDWLTTILQEQKVLTKGEKVTTVNWEWLDNEKGGNSTCFRLSLTYCLTSSREVPSNLFVKTVTYRPYTDRCALNVLNALFPEPAFNKLQINLEHADPLMPRTYYATYSSLSLNYVVIADDLIAQGFATVQSSPDADAVRGAVRTLAAHHARWWENKEIKESRYPYLCTNISGIHSNYPLMELFWSAVSKYPDAKKDDYVWQFLQLSWKNYFRIAEEMDKGPLTVVHVDFRCENLFRKLNEWRIIDWQGSRASNGLWDLVYFMFFELQPNVVKEKQDEILKYYHNELLANGVTKFSFATCQEKYKLAVLWTGTIAISLWGLVLLNVMKEREQQLAIKQVSRFCECFKQLKTLELIKEWEIK